MQQISVFDIFEIGVGPSSSHTLGPWKSAQHWIETFEVEKVTKIEVALYGSLSLTGKGHATDTAILMGLMGYEAKTIDTDQIESYKKEIIQTEQLRLGGSKTIAFAIETDMVFHKTFLDYHPNAMKFTAYAGQTKLSEEHYYSIGGGFIVRHGEEIDTKLEDTSKFSYPIQKAFEIKPYLEKTDVTLAELILLNEISLRTREQVKKQLLEIWDVMLLSIHQGVTREGILPGKLKVKRRASALHQKLFGKAVSSSKEVWLEELKTMNPNFQETMKWISCFALAVNEQNASLGRIVTSPTNGSAGVIPSVLLYYISFINPKATDDQIVDFLLIAGEIGSLFKKGATISAAMGGCQAEIGVSSAMAAAGYAYVLGAGVDQVLQAAEIAMEHHLGLTCDPIAGLVQVPCIERNSMGAIKAINAAELAVETEEARVSLDEVIETMWQTAQDMNRKYKETSEGGLAVGVHLSNC